MLMTDQQASELAKPGVGSFDDPTPLVAPQCSAIRIAPLLAILPVRGDQRRNAPRFWGARPSSPPPFKIGCSGLAAPKGQFKSLRRCLPNSGTTLGEASHFRLAGFESWQNGLDSRGFWHTSAIHRSCILAHLSTCPLVALKCI